MSTNKEPTYKCDCCQKEYAFSDIAYMGTDEEECNPFVPLEIFCRRCLDIDPDFVLDCREEANSSGGYN